MKEQIICTNSQVAITAPVASGANFLLFADWNYRYVGERVCEDQIRADLEPFPPPLLAASFLWMLVSMATCGIMLGTSTPLRYLQIFDQ